MVHPFQPLSPGVPQFFTRWPFDLKLLVDKIANGRLTSCYTVEFEQGPLFLGRPSFRHYGSLQIGD